MTPQKERLRDRRRLQRRLAATVRRLTRRSLTSDERRLVALLYPWTHTTFMTRPAKLFLRRIGSNEFEEVQLTDMQQRFLWRIAFRHRERLPKDLHQAAHAKREWAFTRPPWAEAREDLTVVQSSEEDE